MKIKANKSLGQNFLKDEKILQTIAELVKSTKNDLIIEIGPGMGALTKYLVKKESKVLAYEIDKRMKSYLNFDNLDVVYQDFLLSDLKEIKEYKPNNIYIVANIPYYITTYFKLYSTR